MDKICILGLGYIGLPTASMFAAHGKQVVGVDINELVVTTLNRGDIHIEEPGLGELVSKAVASGKLTARQAPEAADAFIIAVPTPILEDHSADLRAVKAATRAILPVLRPGNLVILESTSPPRTTLDVVRPILEESGLKAGQDFLLAYSPERVLPGRIVQELVENDRVVGGINRASAEAARDLYAAFVKGQIMMTEATTAEMCKLMENTFRDVNIALANEFARISEHIGINVWEAIALANHHPRVNILRPGPGVGGHCIAVDPWFLVEAAPEQARIIEKARRINDAMPDHVIEHVEKMLADAPKNPVVACLGLTFKADVDDMRESPAVEVVHRLAKAGYAVRTFDPHVTGREEHQVGSLEEALSGADLLLLLVDHREFKTLSPEAARAMRGLRVYDTRNCLDAAAWKRAGFQVELLGSEQPYYFEMEVSKTLV